MTYEKLVLKNPKLNIFAASDKSNLFEKVDIDADDIVLLSKKLSPEKANAYIRDDEDERKLQSVSIIKRKVFAEYPVQAGWCFGGSEFMNGFEWHKSSETVVACTPMVLLLGAYEDVIDDVYDSANAVGLYLEKGEVVELKPMTLHLAPLPVDEFFAAAIILPDGTNSPLSGGIDGTLRAVNKWLIVHADNKRGIELGGKIGVVGKNIKLNK